MVGVDFPSLSGLGAHGLIPVLKSVPEQVVQHSATRASDLDTVGAIQQRMLPLMKLFRERSALEGPILMGGQVKGWRTGFDRCPNCATGLRVVDPATAATPALGGAAGGSA